MNTAREIPSVNFHLWQPCNMRCGFCFAQFLDVKKDILPKGHLNRDECIKVVRLLAQAAFDKINFAGGEPTLCPWLAELIRTAKEEGMTTAIVTNGTKITPEWLDGVAGQLDWMAISVDTVNPMRLTKIGRTTSSGVLSEQDYLRIIGLVKKRGIRLKINTVVTAATWDEDFTGFIEKANPDRWKILQALPVAGQNDGEFEKFSISQSQFQAYVNRNYHVAEQGIAVVPEDNTSMRGSYVMVDPAGRFLDSVQGKHTYSKSIIEVGVEAALKDIFADPDLFQQRGGLYEW